jgi:hypothetical protein
VGRPNMRFVPVKSIEQQDIQMLHRIRSGLVKRPHRPCQPGAGTVGRVWAGGRERLGPVAQTAA